MKKTLIALCMLFVAVYSVQAQDDAAEQQAIAEELSLIKIDMTVDTTLFKEVANNTYMSDSPKAMVMAMVVPENYEAAKSKLVDDVPPDFKLTGKGEKMMNGVKILYLEGVANAQGTDVNSTIYCFKRDAETCIMFMGMSEIGIAKKYTEAITVAANSVVKKQ